MQNGLLLIQLGTPNHPSLRAVGRYLREFLADKRVIDLPAAIRYILLYGFILPLRTQKSRKAYQAIWMSQGSPLRYYSEQLRHKLQHEFGRETKVALGMRYGEPSLKEALLELKECKHITILPLYPQYASSATGSAIEAALTMIAKEQVIPSLSVIRDFYQHASYLDALSAQINHSLTGDEYVLFSYHGLPEKHIIKSGCHHVCQNECPSTSLPTTNPACYRAQCFETTRLLAKRLHLKQNTFSTCFQSRLGKTPWITPYLDHVLTELSQKGITKLAIACPSFVTDCLETLEEINIRAREQWQALGGTHFTFIPALNDSTAFVNSIKSMCK